MNESSDRRETTHTVKQHPARAVRARAVPHRLAPSPPCRRRRADAGVAALPPCTDRSGLRDARHRVRELPVALAGTARTLTTDADRANRTGLVVVPPAQVGIGLPESRNWGGHDGRVGVDRHCRRRRARDRAVRDVGGGTPPASSPREAASARSTSAPSTARRVVGRLNGSCASARRSTPQLDAPAAERRRARERYEDAMGRCSRRFVDRPQVAVADADSLLTDVMRDRGYPIDDFDAKSRLVSVDHPDVVENYRTRPRHLHQDGRGQGVDRRPSAGRHQLPRAVRGPRAGRRGTGQLAPRDQVGVLRVGPRCNRRPPSTTAPRCARAGARRRARP